MTIIVLTVLQLLGLALAAGAAIANLVKSKGVEEIRTPSPIIGGPETVTRRLTREAQIGIWLLIAGLSVSLVAKSIEQYLTNRRNTESQRATSKQLQKAEDQLRLASESLAKMEEQALQSREILTNVEQQGAIARQSLDALSAQSARTRTILTNVEFQGQLAKQSLEALSSQSDQARVMLAELQHQNSLAEESRKKAEQQVEAANLSLRYVERLLTPLDSISVSATYELPTNIPWASALVYQISPRAAIAQQAATNLAPGFDPDFLREHRQKNESQITEFPPGATFAPIELTNRMEAIRGFAWPASAATPTNPSGLFRVAAWIVEPGSIEDSDELSAVGYLNVPGATNLVLIVNPTESFFSLGPDDIPGVKHGLFGTNVKTHIRLDSLTNRFWAASVKPKGRAAWAAWKAVWADLAVPDMRLEITRESSFSKRLPPDLVIKGPGRLHSASLIFLPASGKLALVWEFSSVGSSWDKSQKLQSIPDLAEATLRVRSELPFKIVTPHAICLRTISLRFRGSTLVLTNFHSVDVRDDRWAETTLPNRTNILAHEYLQ